MSPMVPEPVGDIVLDGVNEIMSSLLEEVDPHTSELDFKKI
jgi:hypothetical protein